MSLTYDLAHAHSASRCQPGPTTVLREPVAGYDQVK
jgi:hypothetical protein